MEKMARPLTIMPAVEDGQRERRAERENEEGLEDVPHRRSPNLGPTATIAE